MQLAKDKVGQADSAERSGQGSRAIFESAGAARAMVEAKRQWLSTRETRRTGRESIARDSVSYTHLTLPTSDLV